ncbi:MAG TPA: CHAT domain-containing protein [Blastocatellia bacterium]|nr:CHAT domain-containing protein [Blastocatellia bacterium]
MSRELANRLIDAESPQAFLLEQNGSAGWQTLAELKPEVDHLVRCDMKTATRLVDRIEQLAVLLGDPISRAFADANNARLLHHTGRHAEADSIYKSASAGLQKAGLDTEAAVIQNQRVDVLMKLGRYQAALRQARAARRVLAEAGPVHLAQLETHIGNVYYQQDRYKKALEHYDRARLLLSSAGDDTMRALVDFSRSNVFILMDQPDEALALLESAAAAYDRAGQELFAAHTRYNIAYLEFLRGNYNTALASYYQARDKLTQLGSPQLVAWCNLETSEILLALNAFDDAAETAEAARARFDELGMPYESARAALIYALALAGQRQFDDAQGCFEQARKAFKSSGNRHYIAQADLYLAELALRRGSPKEALAKATSSMRMFDRRELPAKSSYCRMIAARAVYESGDRARALRLARSALRAVEGLFAPSIAYQCYHLIACAERDRHRKGAALENFRRAVETVEQMRGGIAADELKVSFLNDKISVYEDAIAACLDEGSQQLVEEAFRLVESSKSRSLADLIARYVRDSQEGEEAQGDETRSRLSKLIEDLNWYSSHANIEEDKGDQRRVAVANRYRKDMFRCERQIAQLFRRIEAEGSAFAEIQRMRAATVADLRSVLEEDETAIEYFTTGDEVSAFIATRGEIRVARHIASKREVDQLLEALRFQIEKFNYGADYVETYFSQLKRSADDHLSRLYEMIFAPIESALAGTRLVVIPHGPLHYVPFHALKNGSSYLVDQFEISYSPSAAVLKLCRARGERKESQISDLKFEMTGGTLVALGVAEQGTPSIEEEIRALGAIFPEAVRLTGADATRDNLLRVAPRARFLHLASHGYFRRDNPMFSFLKLADSPLNFYSLLDLKLNAELVTLSACHTGVNMIFPGDELHGLMRGFLYAGAPSLVVSLWAVSDRSTADLMREMYSHIRAGRSKREALRLAQLKVKDAYGHPYYWAPFVLMGDPV